MSTKHNERNEQNLLTTSIKLEHDTDDDESTELMNKTDSYVDLSSASTTITASLFSAYKGKIEVTSKGRRKIFDGVRWQILCRRPECRKQTNKKSLCITHYKEEYESNARTSSSWSNNLHTFRVPSYQQRHSLDSTKIRSEIENQNNTITTTNIIDNNEQVLLNSNNNRSVREGQIECMDNGRRFIFKNSRWQALCKYDNICRNLVKHESLLLCIKHLELTQSKRRNSFKFHHNDKQRLHSSLLDKHRSVHRNDIAKRLKTNGDFQISSSSITEQFDINSHETSHTSTEPVHDDSYFLSSKLSGQKLSTSSKRNLNLSSMNYSLVDKPNSKFQNDQSVQTDLTIPLCCIIQYENHSIHATCPNNKCTSSILSMNTKSEPQSFDTNLST